MGGGEAMVAFGFFFFYLIIGFSFSFNFIKMVNTVMLEVKCRDRYQEIR